MHSIWVTIIGCTFIFAGGYTSLMKAPVGNIKSLSISDCESTTKQITNLYNINESGEKALDATIALPDDFDGTKTKFTLDVAKWEGNTWREDIYNAEGKLCEYIKKYIPKMWEKIRANLKPPIETECSAKKGTYDLKKFQASSADIGIPTMWYGKFKLTFKVFKPDTNDILLCKIYQGESSA